ncbi:MAG: hypothetical protein BZY75_06085 [SAR202 cluster bacterium Io17-Chloro-G7]|nr:MAG: hypothetical protein BZY75_06085 [SAR202 cluster bacterium Io17-Chloro-G7]
MPLYFLLGTMTTTGQKLLHENHDLVVESTRNIEVEGAEIMGQYAVLGRYDYLMMVEADDNEAVAKLSLEMGVKTGLHVETLPAIAIGFLDNKFSDDPTWSLTSIENPLERENPIERPTQTSPEDPPEGPSQEC